MIVSSLYLCNFSHIKKMCYGKEKSYKKIKLKAC
jgi:hypothetical protein